MKRWLIYGCIIAMILPFMAFTVFATDANGNEFVNIDDYAEYSFYDDNTKVFVDCLFPTDWIQTRVFQGGYSGDDLVSTHYGSSVNITADVTGTMLYMRPFGGNAQVGDNVGKQIMNTHIIDLTYIPKNSSFHTDFFVFVDFDVDQFSPDPADFEGYQRLFFVDKNGVVVGRHFKWVRPEFSDGPSTEYCFKFCFENDLSTMNIPDTAVGVVPVYQLWDETTDFDYRITGIEYFPFQFTYSLSALEFEYIENEKLQNTMINVQNALVEQSEQLGDLNNKVDQLPDQIGDQMQNVADNEKNEANSSGNGSVDQMIQIIPDYSTGLIEGVKKLAASISYEGTECKLKMPALTIPALKGVTAASITFLDEQEVDLEIWFNRMPSEFMAVTRALFDLAVVGFCFYELYDLASQVANGARKAEKVSK